MHRLSNYQHYIEIDREQLDTIFEQQREYICCCEGCSSCCEEGMYPYSELEFRYLMIGFRQLSDEEKEQVISETKKLLEIYKEKNCECFMHKCPFLINKKCSVYNYRGFICRTHGLITENDSGKLTLPYCVGFGKNYSKVYDESTKMIQLEKVKECGYKTIPEAHNLSRKNLMHLSVAEKLGLDFGETKMLIEWLFLDVL